MTTSEKAKAVRNVLLSDPREAGPEFDAFRAALKASFDKPTLPPFLMSFMPPYRV
jgi:hypothetical protein